VLGVTRPAATPSAVTASLQAALAALRNSDPARADEAARLLEQAASCTARGDSPGAIDALARAADLLDPPSEPQQAASLATGLIEAQQCWDQARAGALAEAAGLASRLQNLSAAHAAGLHRVIDSYWHDLAILFPAPAALSVAKDAEAARTRVLEASLALHAELAADPLMDQLAASGAAVGAAFVAAFHTLERLLRPAREATAPAGDERK
jgi:hypothetical protein